MPRGCVNRIRFWPLRRDDHSGVLIGTGGTWRSDWPARVKVNESIDSPRAGASGSLCSPATKVEF